MTDLPDPEIVDSDGQTFVGLAETFDMTRRGEIPALYDRFAAARDGIGGEVKGALYGLSLDARPDGTFRYAVAVEVPVPGLRPDGFCVIEATAGTYAVFRQRTPITDLPARFDAIYPALAERYGLTLYPFFLDGIIGDRAQHLDDMIHPNRQGVETIAARMAPTVEAFLDRIRQQPVR